MDFNLTADELRQIFDAVQERDMVALRKQKTWLEDEIAKQNAAIKYRHRLPDDKT